jgi:hypothetical protein
VDFFFFLEGPKVFDGLWIRFLALHEHITFDVTRAGGFEIVNGDEIAFM